MNFVNIKIWKRFIQLDSNFILLINFLDLLIFEVVIFILIEYKIRFIDSKIIFIITV